MRIKKNPKYLLLHKVPRPGANLPIFYINLLSSSFATVRGPLCEKEEKANVVMVQGKEIK